MLSVRLGLPLFLAALVGIVCGCSEEYAPLDSPDARASQGLVATVAGRFPVLKPHLERAQPLARVAGGFHSIVDPTDEERDALNNKGGTWSKPGNHRLVAELPRRASGIMRISNGPVTMEVRAIGARDVSGVTTDNALVYRDAYPHADSFITAEKERVEEFVVLHDDQAPRRFVYELKAVRGGGRVRQLEPGLSVEVLDAKGNAWLRLARPWVEDAGGERHDVDVSLEGTTLTLTLPEAVRTFPALLDPTWETTSSMNDRKWEYTATLLGSGKVMVAGSTGTVASPNAELYNPATGTWTYTGGMKQARGLHTATLLSTGKVLVVAGRVNRTGYGYTGSAELYDPSTGSWTGAGSAKSQILHTATLLGSGKVLVTGGFYAGSYWANTWLYDPPTNKWAAATSLPSGRAFHTATRLSAGNVLVVGGSDGTNTHTSALLYDPSTGKWTSTGSMVRASYSHTATLLGSGKVLVAGGHSGLTTLASAMLYDPSTAKWAATGSMAKARYGHTATRLVSGKVLVVGGRYGKSVLGSTELYDPATGKWTSAGYISKSRYAHTATLLGTTKVLVAGGISSSYTSPYLDTALLYNPSTGTPCKSSTECLSGFCVDGICCKTACMGICSRCVVKNGIGTCSYMSKGKPDPVATLPCTGALACDGLGNCKLALGQACTTVSQCASGICTDGVCCDKACTSTCEACNLSGKAGTCTGLPAGQPDKSATKPCDSGGTMVCDGKGSCKLALGRPCNGGGPCVSGYCADSVCCDKSCLDTCKNCGLAGSKGTCSPVALGQPDAVSNVPCTGFFACDGAGGCKSKKVTTCTSGSQCPSGFCVDGWCCYAACIGTCKTCNLSGLEGFCANVPVGKPDSNATQVCTGNKVCDGKGGCLTDKGKGCTANSECLTGHCADGYCCDASCTGTCQACNLPLKLGTCSYVAQGKQDQKASTPCQGTKACDGKGGCFTATGKACKAGSECVTGFCSDGFCCDTACTGTCLDCSRSGLEGKCSPVPSGQSDKDATVSCVGTQACDGKGSCKSKTASVCTSSSQCLSGTCSDGFCCNKDCSAACLSCGLSSSPGFCVFISSGQQDTNATKPCTGTDACDGKGSCKKNKGQTCTSSSECLSGYCVDGYCCDTACTGACKACNLSGTPGKCGNLPTLAVDKNATVPCTGTQACDGNGNCKAAVGQICSDNADCANATCKDQVCCQTKCDGNCMSCNLTGALGTCTFDPVGTKSTDCQGKDTACGGECDGKGKCDYPTIGTLCSTCMACDGTGQCTKTPLDDTKCGTIDCDKLDTKCRDYHDLTANRCQSLGSCKTANTTATCTKFTDLCSDGGTKDLGQSADKGTTHPKVDQGVKPPADDESGCNCRVAADGNPPGLTLFLVLIGWVARRRVRTISGR